MKFDLGVRFASEFLGTAFLVAAVVGSGIMGERLAGGNIAVAFAGQHDRNWSGFTRANSDIWVDFRREWGPVTKPSRMPRLLADRC
jgi:hypothetical protein